jgi:5'-3' exonuclease
MKRNEKSVVKVRKVRRSDSYARSLLEIKEMLDRAKNRQQKWHEYYRSGKMSTKENAEALRNYTALRGVIKTLEWVLGEEEIPLS